MYVCDCVLLLSLKEQFTNKRETGVLHNKAAAGISSTLLLPSPTCLCLRLQQLRLFYFLPPCLSGLHLLFYCCFFLPNLQTCLFCLAFISTSPLSLAITLFTPPCSFPLPLQFCPYLSFLFNHLPLNCSWHSASSSRTISTHSLSFPISAAPGVEVSLRYSRRLFEVPGALGGCSRVPPCASGNFFFLLQTRTFSFAFDLGFDLGNSIFFILCLRACVSVGLYKAFSMGFFF